VYAFSRIGWQWSTPTRTVGFFRLLRLLVRRVLFCWDCCQRDLPLIRRLNRVAPPLISRFSLSFDGATSGAVILGLARLKCRCSLYVVGRGCYLPVYSVYVQLCLLKPLWAFVGAPVAYCHKRNSASECPSNERALPRDNRHLWCPAR